MSKNQSIILIVCAAYLIIYGVIIELRKRRAARLKKTAYALFAELQLSGDAWFSAPKILKLISLSKADFKKLCVIYFKEFNENLCVKLYEALQPNHLEQLELLISKSKFERIAKTFLLEGVARKLYNFLNGSNRHIFFDSMSECNLCNDELQKILRVLPDGGYNDLRFVYLSKFGADLNELDIFSKHTKEILKRLF